MNPLRVNTLRAFAVIALPMLLMAATCEPPVPTDPGYDCDAQPAYKPGKVIKVANAIANQYIVILENKPGINSLMQVEGFQAELRNGYAARLAKESLERTLANPNVKVVFEDGRKKVDPRPGEETRLWGLDRIDARDGLDGQYNPDGDGAGVNVAVVDTGVSSHPDFEGRLQADCFFSTGGSCEDGHGHGTHVAGTVGSNTWGVAKKVKLYSVRVLDSNGSGTDSGVIRGIEWVTSKKLANPAEEWVINMSLGGSDSPPLNQSTCDAIKAGVVVVVAAGNESTDADRSSPARVKQAITAGASTRADAKASFSNYGTLIDLFAPGVDIESTRPGGGTNTFSGTSMASPHVAGGAALYMGRHPGSTPAVVRDGLVAVASVDKLGSIGTGSPNLLEYVKEN